MRQPISEPALEQLFGAARTYNGWTDEPVAEDSVRAVYELLKWGPTSANTCPARFVWVRSAEGKARLASCAMAGNRAKILAAPLTVIIGHDLEFADAIPKLSPTRAASIRQWFVDPDVAAVTAMRNGTLQGGYLMLAARALGLDCGPMSGFDNAAVDRAFFADTRIRSNFICSLGHGRPESLHPRGPRLSFEEAGRFA